MNYFNIVNIRSKASTWSIIFFSSILIIGVLASIFFQAPTRSNHTLSRLQTLVPYSHLSSITGFNFSNRLGDFSLDKINETEWMLIKPRILPAKLSTVNLILTELKNIKIKEVLSKDLINISNYSLESPLFKIDLKSNSSHQDQTQVSISFGLVNPIDHSTYVMLSNNDAIYHTSSLVNTLESLALSDFVDSKIFPVPEEDIIHFETFRGNPLKSDLKLGIYKDQDDYKNKRGTRLHPKRIHKFFNSVHSIKSYFLIDKQTDRLKEQIKNLLQKPLYTVLIKSKDGSQYTFKITGTINKLDGIKMERRRHFLIQASHRKYPYLVNKESLKYFYKTNKSFKKLSIKKLFY